MPTERCSAHPGRPAVDRCPVCDRPRCGADVQPGGCALCDPPAQPGQVRRGAGQLELLVRACLAAFFAGLAGGYVTQQYVEAPMLQYFAPAVLGVVCAASAVAAAGHPRKGQLSLRVRAAASIYAVLGLAWGFQLDGTFAATATDSGVLVPYVITAAAAWLWGAPPRARKKKSG